MRHGKRKYLAFGFSYMLDGKRIRSWEYYAPGHAQTLEYARRELIEMDWFPVATLRVWPLKKRKKR